MSKRSKVTFRGRSAPGPMVRAADGSVTFTCTDCGNLITSFGTDDMVPVCASCRWLNTIEDPAERERVRAHLNRPLT